MAKMTIYSLPTKTRVALLRARKPTKMTKMAGVPQTTPGFAKNRVFATLKKGNGWRVGDSRDLQSRSRGSLSTATLFGPFERDHELIIPEGGEGKKLHCSGPADSLNGAVPLKELLFFLSEPLKAQYQRANISPIGNNRWGFKC